MTISAETNRIETPPRLPVAMGEDVMARVALLFITTSLFAAIWSEDQTQQKASVERITKAATVRPAFRVASSNGSRGVRRVTVPLPDQITPGTYLVSDQWGRTQVREVSESEAIIPREMTESPVTNHYLVERGSFRWHFIRIEQPRTDLAHRVHAVSLR
ncbi:hypothetical protein [Schlesneria sp. T3-172]|uniref:hypothetical protein n=1 Tax=Schlesneria sphaerica TaxID=3373610 RepID=UPI0037C9F575